MGAVLLLSFVLFVISVPALLFGRTRRWAKWTVIVGFLGFWWSGYYVEPSSSRQGGTSTAGTNDAATSERVSQSAARASTPTLDRFHCLSAWDGTYSALINAVKENLRDPGSFEHVETRISEIREDGRQEVIMRYRAKNGFGGLNVQYAKGTLFNLNCDLLEWKG